MKALFVFGGILGTLAIMALGAMAATHLRIRRAFRQLRRLEKKHLRKDSVHHYKLMDLPNPVRRYFELVLKDGQPTVRFAHLRLGGQFRRNPNDEWSAMHSYAHYAGDEPGFVWKGRFGRFFTRMTANITYQSGHGGSFLRLYDIFPLLNSSGEESNISMLTRYLFEAVWFPTALLPDAVGVEWTPMDDSRALASIRYCGVSIRAVVVFDDSGYVARMETNDKYRDFRNHFEKSPFTMVCEQYQEWQGIKIPEALHFTWNLPEGDFHYATFTVREAKYEY